MKLYGLKSNKQNCLMSFTTSSNDGDFCNDIEYSLSNYHSSWDNLWVTADKKIADTIACVGPTAWYNASHRSPNWDKDYYSDLEVVCLNEVGG